MYDAVFFDLDGTLIDSAEGITSSVKYSLDKLNIKNYDPEILKKFIGPALIWAYKEYFNLDEETANKAVCYYRENYVDKAMYLNVIYDGMEDTLKELKKRGKKLFVATAKPESYARKIIDKMGLSKYFDFIVGNDPDKVRLTKEYFVIFFESDLLKSIYVTLNRGSVAKKKAKRRK